MNSLITVKIRLRDKHASVLRKQSASVNTVWNYCNETQKKAAQAKRKWFSGIDLMSLTAGSAQLLDLNAATIQLVCKTYDQSRKQHKKPWLRWRGRKSLGWVPFRKDHVLFTGSTFVFRGVQYYPMHMNPHLQPGMRFGAGSFNADAKGNWYINVPVEMVCAEPKVDGAVGVDLGLKTLATLSDGKKIEAPRFYRNNELALATAQRARKTKRARAIHAKARNRRKDFLHKASLTLVREYGTIIVGDVSPSKLAKTKLAKSVNDAGWAGFKAMLAYKAIRHGGRFLEVSEAYSSLTCSACGSRSGPKGLKGLGIREWACTDCGTVHNRDVNGAQNILRVGLDTLVAGAQGTGSSHTHPCRRDVGY